MIWRFRNPALQRVANPMHVTEIVMAMARTLVIRLDRGDVAEQVQMAITRRTVHDSLLASRRDLREFGSPVKFRDSC
jgi:hypothetical protein